MPITNVEVKRFNKVVVCAVCSGPTSRIAASYTNDNPNITCKCDDVGCGAEEDVDYRDLEPDYVAV